MLLYTIPSVPDVDISTLVAAEGKECYNCYGLNHYTALCRHPKQRKKTALSGPLADPTIGNIPKADMVVIPPASTGSCTTEVPVLPTHKDHLISQGDREALLDLNK